MLSRKTLNAVWVHDHFFEKKKDGSVWSESQFEKSLWSRYLEHFSSLTVIGRDRLFGPVSEKGWYVESSTDRVHFKLFPSLSGQVNMVKNSRRVHTLLINEIKDHDAVIVRLPSELGYAAIKCAKKLNKPYAVEVVGCAWDALFYYGSTVAKLYAPVAMARMKRAVYHADHALYVTKAFLQNRYPTKSTISLSASNVSLEALDNEVLDRRLKKITGPNNGKIILGMIGSLVHKYKGLHLLLCALRGLFEKYPDIKLRVLGTGDVNPWKELAKKYGVSEVVQFDGVLSERNKVLNWLDNIDIYVQPSLQEGLPRALIEAMSRGLPCIGSDAAGIPELLDRADIFRKGSSDQLLRILSSKLLDRDWQMNAASRNFTTASEYQSNILVPKRFKFFESFSQRCLKND